MTYIRDATAPSITLPKSTKSGKKQTRPPVAVEFWYHAKDWKGLLTYIFTYFKANIFEESVSHSNLVKMYEYFHSSYIIIITSV